MSPEYGFNKPKIKSASVLLPDPLFPIIPILEPAGISIFMFF